MKKVIKASIERDQAYKHANIILRKAQDLLDALDNTPSGFVDSNDLADLYQSLIDDIPALSFAISSGIIEYKKDRYGIISEDSPERFI